MMEKLKNVSFWLALVGAIVVQLQVFFSAEVKDTTQLIITIVSLIITSLTGLAKETPAALGGVKPSVEPPKV